jgi:mono/diheme cytochrome c family protein
MRKQLQALGILIGLGLTVLTACQPSGGLPAGPTPIPTLAPAPEIEAEPLPTETPVHAILSFPARLPSAEEGQAIYDTYCAECHAADGTGAVPEARNFRDLDYMRGETPASFYAAVTEGREDMPAYQETLSSDERWDAVFYIWRLATDRQTLEQGEQIYAENCATCHGEAGSGELLGSADFTDLREIADLAPRDLYLTVTQGRGSMPGWQSLLSQDQRWAVIDYVLAFSYDASLEAAPEATAMADAPTQPPSCDPSQEIPFALDDSEAIEAGRLTFDAQCAICHGEQGSGGLPGTGDFSSPELHSALRDMPGEAFCIISEGEGTMPAFKQTLTEDERWQVLTFLTSLGQ